MWELSFSDLWAGWGNLNPNVKKIKAWQNTTSAGFSNKKSGVAMCIKSQTVKVKIFMKDRYYSAFDQLMKVFIKIWRRSLENRIDDNHFDPELSRKIDSVLILDEA